MKRMLNKGLLTVAGIASIAGSTAAVISCGSPSSKSNEQNDENNFDKLSNQDKFYFYADKIREELLGQNDPIDINLSSGTISSLEIENAILKGIQNKINSFLNSNENYLKYVSEIIDTKNILLSDNAYSSIRGPKGTISDVSIILSPRTTSLMSKTIRYDKIYFVNKSSEQIWINSYMEGFYQYILNNPISIDGDLNYHVSSPWKDDVNYKPIIRALNEARYEYNKKNGASALDTLVREITITTTEDTTFSSTKTDNNLEVIKIESGSAFLYATTWSKNSTVSGVTEHSLDGLKFKRAV